jgi:hypothetical protein
MVDYLLADPAPVWAKDLETVTIVDQPQHIELTRTVKRAGRLDGFCTYFNAIFDDELSFTTQPLQSTTQHWSIPLFRVETRQWSVGDRINFSLEMTDIAIRKPMFGRGKWRHEVPRFVDPAMHRINLQSGADDRSQAHVN